ncbi:HugZ family protein [Alteromonas sp. H39]|uniref:HugZ family pyridoxamine 5'-phosphate oxidase n=1 Tax=Alteromonas sp. H39 TaxID=3389876 RepID=UPI0039DF53E4
MSMQQVTFDAKHLSRTHHSGVLSTLSTSMPGYPFGSVVPFYLTAQGDAIIYISDIALHTRNIKADPKVSLTIFDAEEDDSQASGRVTLLGNAERVATEDVKAQYFALFVQATRYEQTHDFNFYKIRTERVRYIGGFGKIHWISKTLWFVPQQDWHNDISGMINHMNEDHVDAMQAFIRVVCDVDCKQPEMISVFPEGAHYRCDEKVVYVPFHELCHTPTQVRQALVKLTQEAREQLGIKKAG